MCASNNAQDKKDNEKNQTRQQDQDNDNRHHYRGHTDYKQREYVYLVFAMNLLNILC